MQKSVVGSMLLIELSSGQGTRDSLLVHLAVSVLCGSMFLGGLLTVLQDTHFFGDSESPAASSLHISGIRLDMLWHRDWCGGGALVG